MTKTRKSAEVQPEGETLDSASRARKSTFKKWDWPPSARRLQLISSFTGDVTVATSTPCLTARLNGSLLFFYEWK